MNESSFDYDCLYVVAELGTHYCKIGICKSAGNVESRIKSLQIGNPRRLYFRRIFRVEHAYKVEQYFHSKFDKFRVLGEWFNLKNKNLLRHVDSTIRKNEGTVVYTE